LAGDTFDWLVTDLWCGAVRPWQAGRRARAARRAVATRTLWAARRVMGHLARWVRRGVPVSAADRRGRPDWTARHTVPVRLTLLAGDRDSWLAEVAVPTRRHPFGAGIRWSDGVLAVRHGHDLDPACHGAAGMVAGPDGRSPTLSESVAVDLLVPFAVAMRAEQATWRVVRPLIRLLATSRTVDMPTRLARWAAAAEGGGAADVLHGSIEPAWRRAVEAWFETTRCSVPDCAVEFDAVEALAPALGAALERVADTESAALLPRLACAADHESARHLLGHRSGECRLQDTARGGEEDMPAISLPPAGDEPAAVVVRVDEGGRTCLEHLSSVTGAPAVITIDRPEARWTAGGRVVDAA
ncbi:MAG: hypothetical protein EBR23_05570, partial [Planctomycetia bacterium]|nr:hypothetical protein [Planctomycetia bacterium]